MLLNTLGSSEPHHTLTGQHSGVPGVKKPASAAFEPVKAVSVRDKDASQLVPILSL